MFTSMEKHLHEERRSVCVDRKPKFSSRIYQWLLCDLGKMLAEYPRDMGRELMLQIPYFSPCPVAGDSGVLLLIKAVGLTYPIPKG